MFSCRAEFDRDEIGTSDTTPILVRKSGLHAVAAASCELVLAGKARGWNDAEAAVPKAPGGHRVSDSCE